MLVSCPKIVKCKLDGSSDNCSLLILRNRKYTLIGKDLSHRRARKLGLDNHLIVGGALKAPVSDSMMGEVFEALIGNFWPWQPLLAPVIETASTRYALHVSFQARHHCYSSA